MLLLILLPSMSSPHHLRSPYCSLHCLMLFPIILFLIFQFNSQHRALYGSLDCLYFMGVCSSEDNCGTKLESRTDQLLWILDTAVFYYFLEPILVFQMPSG